MTDEKLYYVQDKRKVVGNCAMWWKKGDGGYTCDIRAAKKFTEQQTKEVGDNKKAWPIEIVDRISQHHIDVQDLHSGAVTPHTLR